LSYRGWTGYHLLAIVESWLWCAVLTPHPTQIERAKKTTPQAQRPAKMARSDENILVHQGAGANHQEKLPQSNALPVSLQAAVQAVKPQQQDERRGMVTSNTHQVQNPVQANVSELKSDRHWYVRKWLLREEPAAEYPHKRLRCNHWISEELTNPAKIRSRAVRTATTAAAQQWLEKYGSMFRPNALGFFDLPAEIRNRIYQLLVPDWEVVAKRPCLNQVHERLHSCPFNFDLGASYLDEARPYSMSYATYPPGGRFRFYKSGVAPFYHLHQVLVNRQFYVELGAVIEASQTSLRYIVSGASDVGDCDYCERGGVPHHVDLAKALARVRNLTIELRRSEGLEIFCQLVLPKLDNLAKATIEARVGFPAYDGRLELTSDDDYQNHRGFFDCERLLEKLQKCLSTNYHFPSLLEAGRTFRQALLGQLLGKMPAGVRIGLVLKVGLYKCHTRYRPHLGIRLGHFAVRNFYVCDQEHTDRE
jgi:hypothetical protein